MKYSVSSLIKVFPILLLAFAVSPAAAEPAVEATEVAEGRLLAVDTDARTIVIETQDGMQMQFRYDGETQVEGAEGGVEGLVGSPDSFLRVHYRSDGADLLAERIEVLD